MQGTAGFHANAESVTSLLMGESHPLPEYCLHESFELVAARYPQRIALEQGEHRLSYGELNDNSNRLAHWLQQRALGPGDLVALCALPSFDTIVALLAILKVGAAYLPIDPAYSAARVGQIIEVAPLRLVMLDRDQIPASIVETCESADVESIGLTEATEAAAAMSEGNLGLSGLLQHAAYVMYTSGSTGRPKGVMVHHRGAANLVAAMARHWPITEGSRMLQFASLGFDASVPEWAGPLTMGGTVVLKPRGALMLGEDLIELVERTGVNIFKMPASALRVLPRVSLPEVRTIITAGDACTSELVAHWSRDRRFFNCYGPTEVSIGSTMARLNTDTETVSIGRPNANLRGYVLDAFLQPVADGDVGELYMGGLGVTWGYLGQAGMTASRFLPDPHGEPGARMYRTGDCVRLLPNGELQFLGRIDEQVKVRGFRIELGEIEQALLKLDGVDQAAVAALSEQGGEPRLVGFVCADHAWTGERLREALQHVLPTYMVPMRWFRVEQLPLTINGKVDRAQLQSCPGVRIDAASILEAGDDASAIERQVAAIWSKHLDSSVSLHHSLTALGGDSLMAVRLSQEMREQLGVSFSAAELLAGDGIRALLASLSDANGALARQAPESPDLDMPDLDTLDEAALDRLLAELEASAKTTS